MRALRLIRPRTAVPIHFHDYTVFKDPIDNFKAAVAEASLETTVHYVAHGETYQFSPDHTRHRES